MSNNTVFKRIAFAVVVTLGLGMLGTAPSSAGTIIGETMTVAGSSSAATSSITQGETATVAVVNTFTPEVVNDSIVVITSCAAPSGGSCYNLLDFFWTSTTDSTTNAIGGVFDGSGTDYVQNTDDSFTIASSVAGQAVRFTSSLKFRSTSATTAGVYTVTVYTKRSSAGAAAAVNSASPSITWTVTVAAQATAIAGLNIYVAPTLDQAGYWHRAFATSKDSAVVASDGKNVLTGVVSYTAVAYINFNPKNSLGETTTVANTVLTVASGDVRATVTGPGVITLGSSTTGSDGVKTLTTLTADNNGATGAATETLTVYSDGTPGVSTVTFTNVATGATIGTASVTFTGKAASVTSISLSDTSVAVGTTNVNLSAVLKDAAGNTIPTGSTFYVYASDTKVVSAGANSTTAAQYAQYAAGVRNTSAASCTGGTVVAGRYNCTLTIGDTGTATVVLRDSWTVAASTWVSDALTVTGLGTAAQTIAVAFDKASYVAGEKAVITITATDVAGRAATAATLAEVISSLSLGNLLSGSTNTTAATSATTTTFTGYSALGAESGIETRVVFMPGSSGTLTYSIKYTPTSPSTAVAVTVSATAVISDPAEAAANAATAAANAATAAANAATAAAKAGETAAVAEAQAATAAAKAATDAAKASTAAAEAATDAAAEGVDAANAATDAANLAAEAADAATVAAEEARDAADAATAAVEELATQVATLMAALKAQLTTLANTVAKIAKKVKA